MSGWKVRFIVIFSFICCLTVSCRNAQGGWTLWCTDYRNSRCLESWGGNTDVTCCPKGKSWDECEDGSREVSVNQIMNKSFTGCRINPDGDEMIVIKSCTRYFPHLWVCQKGWWQWWWMANRIYQWQVGCDYTNQNLNLLMFLLFAIHIICLIIFWKFSQWVVWYFCCGLNYNRWSIMILMCRKWVTSYNCN